jgi:hypothetical protein
MGGIKKPGTKKRVTRQKTPMISRSDKTALYVRAFRISGKEPGESVYLHP